MKFVNDMPNLPDEEMEALIKDAELENKQRQDRLGIVETKQAEEPKPQVNLNKKDMVTMTLVNMRKTASKTSEVVMTIKGGETVLAETQDHGEFKKVTYKKKEGYINKKYLR